MVKGFTFSLGVKGQAAIQSSALSSLVLLDVAQKVANDLLVLLELAK